MRVAAVQLEVALADVAANIAECESLAREAAGDGAEAIALRRDRGERRPDRRRRGLLGVHAHRDGAPATRARRPRHGRVELVDDPALAAAGLHAPRRGRERRLGSTRPRVFGRYVGAPVVHAAITGEFACPMPELPAITYKGRFQGGAQIADATGLVLARREAAEGSGYVIADVEALRSPPLEEVPDRFWLHRRGAMPALVWNTQRVLGRRWYARNVRGRPPLVLDSERAAAL